MLLVSPEKIAAVMALAPLPHSFAELDEMVARGLPKGALKASIDHICVSAEARRQLGEIDAAAADLDLALLIARRLQGDKPYSSHVGRTLAALQKVLVARGQAAQARRVAAEATQALEQALGAEHPETRQTRAAATPPP